MTVETEGCAVHSPTLRALFVTADPAAAEHRAALLTEAGIRVAADIVSTREAFERAVASRTYDLVAAEREMPGWTGMEAAAYLRARGAVTPVVLLEQTERPGDIVAGEALAEQRYGRLMESSAAGVFRADLNGFILEANPAMARMLGVETPCDLLGRRTADFCPSSRFGDTVLKRLRGEGSISAVEVRLRRSDGAPLWGIANVHLVAGEASVVEGTVVDITERKLAQERSARLNRLYSVLSHLNQAIVRITDRDSLLQAVCRIAVEDGGFRAAWIGLLDETAGVIRRAAQHGAGNVSLEQMHIEVDGPASQLAPAAGALRSGSEYVVNEAKFGFSSWASLPLNVEGSLAGALNLYADEPGFFAEQNLDLIRNVAEDVSFALDNLARGAERRRSEEERARLYLSEQAARAQASAGARFRELLESAPDAILEADAEGRILVANAAAGRLFQYTRDELLAMRIEDLFAGEWHAPGTGAPLAGLWSRGSGHSSVARRGDKTEFPVEISLSRMDSDRGELVTCIIRDITARQQAEAALHESNRRIANILESITDAFFALDRDWRYTYVNGKAEQILGRKRHDLQGNRIWDVFPDLVGTVFDYEYHRAAAEQRPVEFSAFDAERKLWADVHVYPSEHGLSVYFQDITARKLLEEQSGQSQRLEALGRLAGGVAHDFNNLLTIIGGYGQMLLDSLDGRNPLRKDVEPIVEAAGRASALTRQLLAFSRRQLVQPRVVDLNRLITKMSKMLRRVIGEDIELTLALRSDLGRTTADPGQIEQVIMNLAVNSRDAMPTGGLLTIATDNYEAAGDTEPTGLAPGMYVQLMVSDTGTGMDEHIRAHVFEPFFTTKARGKGTGLGLSTVYGIVKQAGGEIRVDSEPGQGASFRIYLPRTRKPPKGQRASAAPRRPRRGTETILLVEDEAEVRKLACEMLVRLGYRVLEAGDASQALAVWREAPDRVDLLVTDVIMPNMSGTELAAKLMSERPGLKVLYISGYTDEVIARHGVAQDDVALLPKPFSREALGLRVRGILDSERTPPGREENS